MKRYIALILLIIMLFAGCAPEAQPEPVSTEPEKPTLTGWQVIDDVRYYYGEDGAPVTGYQVIEDKAYILSDKGAVLTGWQTLEDKTYYLDESGAALTGWQDIADGRYYFGENGVMYTGWKTIDSETYCFGDNGALQSGWITVNERTYFLTGGQKTIGWQEIDGKTYHFYLDGTLSTGWQEIDGDTYYFNEDGTPYVGWLELEEDEYYFYEDGMMAVGEVEIDGTASHFLANGKRFILVNPWNYIPKDYEVELGKYGGKKMAKDCIEPLKEMLADCKAAGHGVRVVSTYRTNAQQTYLHNRMINRYLGYGYSKTAAKKKASTISAIPGTSEHQLGYAFDIVDSAYVKLNYEQAKQPTQKWLMANSWKYGFTLRYPTGKSEITGIIYEPWHYRYVGKELAKELYDRDVCLEEYFAELTQQQTARRAALQQ